MLKIYMIKILLKFLFATALLYWLIMSGKLDFSLVKRSFQMGPEWLVAFFIIILQSSLAALRYRLLLQTKSQHKLPFFKVLRINYIGQFFSTVLPGAVTGDVVKILYVKSMDQGFSKTFLLTTTLLDRILGLSGLLFLAGTASLVYFSEVTALSSQITTIIYINLVLFSGTLIFLGILGASAKFQMRILNLISIIPFLGAKLSSICGEVFSLREKRKDLVLSFLISVLIQFLNILAFWIISSPFYSGELPLQYAFTFIPVGLIATAIPISPAGLGVGHVMFANLFSFIHINNGASLFNLYFLINIAHNFIGLVPYLLAGNQARASWHISKERTEH